MTVLKTMLFVEGIGLANSVITAENIGVVFNNQHPVSCECKNALLCLYVVKSISNLMVTTQGTSRS